MTRQDKPLSIHGEKFVWVTFNDLLEGSNAGVGGRDEVAREVKGTMGIVVGDKGPAYCPRSLDSESFSDSVNDVVV